MTQNVFRVQGHAALLVAISFVVSIAFADLIESILFTICALCIVYMYTSSPVVRQGLY